MIWTRRARCGCSRPRSSAATPAGEPPRISWGFDSKPEKTKKAPGWRAPFSNGGGSGLVVALARRRADFRLLSLVSMLDFGVLSLVDFLLIAVLLLDVRLRGPSLQFSDRGGVLRLQVRDRLARLIDDRGQLDVDRPGIFHAIFVGLLGGQLSDAAVRLSRNLSEPDRGLGIERLGLGGGLRREGRGVGQHDRGCAGRDGGPCCRGRKVGKARHTGPQCEPAGDDHRAEYVSLHALLYARGEAGIRNDVPLRGGPGYAT